MNGFDRPWWIIGIGGWSIDAFTGVRRDHEDIDTPIVTRSVTSSVR